MKSRVSDVKGESSSDVAAKPFRMMMLFDSASANAEAIRAFEVILRELGDDILVDKSAWDVALLRTASNCRRAAKDAARADMIVIALSETTPSESLRNWTHQWEKHRTLNGGLIALIPSGEAESGGDLAEFLYETAVSANMDFLCRKNRRY
jgi:hypothetical protein